MLKIMLVLVAVQHLERTEILKKNPPKEKKLNEDYRCTIEEASEETEVSLSLC